MIKGTVKWFHNRKFFGFLQDEERGEIIYVDMSSSDDADARSLVEGDKVTFKLVRGPRGLCATDVTKQ